MKMVYVPLTFPSPNYDYNLWFITNWLSPMVTLEKVVVHTKQIISNIVIYYQTSWILISLGLFNLFHVMFKIIYNNNEYV